LKIGKLNLGVKKCKGIDIDWSNPCGDQATHFIGYIENPMFQIPLIIVKKQVTHLKQDQ